jgi:hypothetical protein
MGASKAVMDVLHNTVARCPQPVWAPSALLSAFLCLAEKNCCSVQWRAPVPDKAQAQGLPRCLCPSWRPSFLLLAPCSMLAQLLSPQCSVLNRLFPHITSHHTLIRRSGISRCPSPSGPRLSFSKAPIRPNWPSAIQHHSRASLFLSRSPNSLRLQTHNCRRQLQTDFASTQTPPTFPHHRTHLVTTPPAFYRPSNCLPAFAYCSPQSPHGGSSYGKAHHSIPAVTQTSLSPWSTHLVKTQQLLLNCCSDPVSPATS